jgi:hypothetical protein
MLVLMVSAALFVLSICLTETSAIAQSAPNSLITDPPGSNDDVAAKAANDDLAPPEVPYAPTATPSLPSGSDAARESSDGPSANWERAGTAASSSHTSKPSVVNSGNDSSDPSDVSALNSGDGSNDDASHDNSSPPALRNDASDGNDASDAEDGRVLEVPQVIDPSSVADASQDSSDARGAQANSTNDNDAESLEGVQQSAENNDSQGDVGTLQDYENQAATSQMGVVIYSPAVTMPIVPANPLEMQQPTVGTPMIGGIISTAPTIITPSAGSLLSSSPISPAGLPRPVAGFRPLPGAFTPRPLTGLTVSPLGGFGARGLIGGRR